MQVDQQRDKVEENIDEIDDDDEEREDVRVPFSVFPPTADCAKHYGLTRPNSAGVW